MRHKQNTSFTLIEMLIVVVIIGILAAALIPRLQSVQARARDTKRKADLHQIATAADIYRQDNGTFDSFRDYDGCNAGQSIASPQTMKEQLGCDISTNDGDECHTIRMLSRYMTSVPTDTDQSQWQSDGCTNRYGYVMSILNRNISKSHNNGNRPSANAFVLAARTESDGSSSNRVTSTYNLSNNDDCSGGRCPTTGSAGWVGAIGSAQDNDDVTANLYQQYVCSTVTFTGGTTDNDGQGNCAASKDGQDLRYIYID